MGTTLQVWRARVGGWNLRRGPTTTRGCCSPVVSNPHLPGLTLAALLLASAALASILIIGGVEANPGPTGTGLRREQQAVLGRLLSESTDPEICAVLSCYILDRDESKIVSMMKSKTLEAIRKTAIFLNMPQVKHTKVTLIDLLYQRIENLLPEWCLHCSAVYTVDKVDAPTISCVSCGQGAHQSCVDSLGPQNLLRGYAHICNSCAPKKPEPMKQHAGVKSTDTLIGQNITLNIIDTASEVKQAKPENISDTLSVLHPEAQESNVPESCCKSRGCNPRGPPSGDTPQNTEEPNSLKNPSTCKHFINNKCKYGYRGRDCPFTHPKICHKFMRGGNSKKGCMDKECSFLHPNVCKSSLKDKRCTNKKCLTYHLKGTVRNSSTNSTKTPILKNGKKTDKTQKSNSSHNDEHFLEILQKLSSKIDEMDRFLSLLPQREEDQYWKRELRTPVKSQQWGPYPRESLKPRW